MFEERRVSVNECVSLENCVFVLTRAPLWARMRALRGHFGLSGFVNRFVEVEVLLKERYRCPLTVRIISSSQEEMPTGGAFEQVVVQS